MINPELLPADAAELALPIKDGLRIRNRIFAWLAAYKRKRPEAYFQLVESSTGTSAEVLLVKAMLRMRREREKFLGVSIFGDPAWDILLELFVAHEQGILVSVSSLCMAAAVPNSTAFRWIDNLTKSGILMQTKDINDGRRTWITLSPHILENMRHYLRAGLMHFSSF